MFGLIKTVFFTAMAFFSYNVLNGNSLECVSMNNQQEQKQKKEKNKNKNNKYQQ